MFTVIAQPVVMPGDVAVQRLVTVHAYSHNACGVVEHLLAGNEVHGIELGASVAFDSGLPLADAVVVIKQSVHDSSF